MKKEKIYLVLETGEYFAGDSFGGDFETVYGEVVFNTSITGYLESITDPSYCGQILVQTFPLIGNYGVIPEDFESERPWLSGYIVRDWCETPSNYRSTQRLDEYFKKENIPAMSGIDTRRLTRIIRNNGVMNGMLTKKAPPYSNEELEKIKEYTCAGVVNRVTRKEAKVYESENPKYNVVLWDFGTKENIIRCLTQRGCSLTVVPADTKAEEIKSLNPDGIMLSNGPGDPQENKGVIEELKRVCEYKIPIFGICLGHQLLALSQGAETEKLKYGHRGANQPVKDLSCGRVYISAQNHGYAVVDSSLPEHGKLSFINMNDGSCEGIKYTKFPAFSVQFHPEACAGPLDTMWLFDDFIKLIEENK